MKIEKFDPSTLQMMRGEIQQALDVIKNKYGLSKLQLGNMRYDHDGSSFSSSIDAKIGIDNEAYKKTQIRNAMLLDLPPEILGFKFEHNGGGVKGNFVVKGFNLKKSKYPVICTALDGTHKDQDVNFPEDYIKNLFKK